MSITVKTTGAILGCPATLEATFADSAELAAIGYANELTDKLGVRAFVYSPVGELRYATRPRMLTADTITDDEIRQLHTEGAISAATVEFATAPGWENRSYRSRCAEILNARRLAS